MSIEGGLRAVDNFGALTFPSGKIFQKEFPLTHREYDFGVTASILCLIEGKQIHSKSAFPKTMRDLIEQKDVVRKMTAG